MLLRCPSTPPSLSYSPSLHSKLFPGFVSQLLLLLLLLLLLHFHERFKPSTPNPATGNNNPAWFATDADRLLRFKFMIPGKFMSLLFYFYAPLFLSFSWTKRFIEREKCGVPFLSWIKKNTSSRLAQLELIVSYICCVKASDKAGIKQRSCHCYWLLFLMFYYWDLCWNWSQKQGFLMFLSPLCNVAAYLGLRIPTYNMIQFLVLGSCGNIA